MAWLIARLAPLASTTANVKFFSSFQYPPVFGFDIGIIC